MQHGHVAVDVAQQHGKFIATDARQLRVPWQVRLQVGSQLAQQLIAGRVTTKVVDLLELVEVEVEQVAVVATFWMVQGSLQ